MVALCIAISDTDNLSPDYEGFLLAEIKFEGLLRQTEFIANGIYRKWNDAALHTH